MLHVLHLHQSTCGDFVRFENYISTYATNFWFSYEANHTKVIKTYLWISLLNIDIKLHLKS